MAFLAPLIARGAAALGTEAAVGTRAAGGLFGRAEASSLGTKQPSLTENIVQNMPTQQKPQSNLSSAQISPIVRGETFHLGDLSES